MSLDVGAFAKVRTDPVAGCEYSKKTSGKTRRMRFVWHLPVCKVLCNDPY